MATTHAQVQSEPIQLSSRRRDTEARTPARTSGAVRVGAFLAVETIAAVALFIAEVPALQGALVILLVLIAFDVTADSNPILIYGDNYVSVGFVFVAAMMVLYGPAGVLIAAPLEALAPLLSRDRRVNLWIVHNAAMFALVYTLGAGSYDLIAGVAPEGFHANMLLGIVVASGLTTFANIALLASFGYIYRGESISEFWHKNSWIIPHYFVLGLTGLALALSIVALGLAGLFAFVAPVLVLRFAMKQYVDKTKDNVEKLQSQNRELSAANIEIRRVSEELSVSYDGTLEALVNALDARDQETKGHSLRVQRYMMDIAREFGVPEGSQQWLDMQRGSLLHDVGKIGVSDSILLKPGKLTDEEWGFMRKHPEIGFQMLRQVRFLEGAAEIILAHHERWDGEGYPKGLHEDEIPLGARIFMVCDTFDSMTSDRPYRKALSTQSALNEILKCRGTQFDPSVVEAFLSIYEMWIAKHEEKPLESLRAA